MWRKRPLSAKPIAQSLFVQVLGRSVTDWFAPASAAAQAPAAAARPEPKQRRRGTGPGDPRTQRSLCVPGPFALLGRGCQQHTQLQQTPHRDYPDERDVVTSGCSAGGSGRKDDVRGNSKWVADSLLWTCYFLTRSCDISRIASSIITAAITILLCCSGSDNSPDILLP